MASGPVSVPHCLTFTQVAPVEPAADACALQGEGSERRWLGENGDGVWHATSLELCIVGGDHQMATFFMISLIT